MNTSLNLTRRRNTGGIRQSGQIVGLLKALGVLNDMLYVRRWRQNGSFWMRQINHLDVLEKARQLYLRQVGEVHPDRPGGSHERMVQLNRIWTQIEKRFKFHGYELW